MRFPRFIAAPLLSVVLLAAPATLAGQESSLSPEIRPATFWWDVSVGAASLQLSCDICADAVDSGPFLEVAAGAYATSRLALGIEFGGWTHLDDETREQLVQGALTLRYARSHSEGLHFLVGGGWSSYRVGEFRYGAPRMLLGTGWSFPISEDLSVGTRLVWDIAPFGSLKNDDVTVAESVRLGLLRFTVFLRSNQ